MAKRPAHSRPAAADEAPAPPSSLPEHPADEGLSLEQLTAAFRQMFAQGHDPYGPAADPEEPGRPLPTAAEPETSDRAVAVDTSTSDDRCEITPRSILEALLFVGHPQNEPLTAERVAQLMRGVTPGEVDELVRDLNEGYAAARCPYEIASDGPGYRLELRPELARLRERFFGRERQARLSQAAVEVLALVAYQQPLTADEVERQRGRGCGALLAQLVRRQLLRIERGDTKPRVSHYHTTERFLRLFGLQSLDDLPREADLERR